MSHLTSRVSRKCLPQLTPWLLGSTSGRGQAAGSSSPQGGGVSVTKPGGWWGGQGRAEGREVEHDPHSERAQCRHRAPRCSTREGVQAQRGRAACPGVTELAGSCFWGTQTHQGPPEGCSFGHYSPSRGHAPPSASGSQATGHGWYPVPPPTASPTSPVHRGWVGPLPEAGRSPKHPQVASHVTDFTAAPRQGLRLTQVQMGFTATHQQGDLKQMLCM